MIDVRQSTTESLPLGAGGAQSHNRFLTTQAGGSVSDA
jgi:hypothetical protein